jgi:hypothetical protein
MESRQLMARETGERETHTLYRRWIDELWSGRRIAHELVSADFVGHWPTREVHGPAELQNMVDDTRASFRDLEFFVDVDPFTNGEMLAARWIGTGARKRGPELFAGNDILRVHDGRIVEYWACSSA